MKLTRLALLIILSLVVSEVCCAPRPGGKKGGGSSEEGGEGGEGGEEGGEGGGEGGEEGGEEGEEKGKEGKKGKGEEGEEEEGGEEGAANQEHERKQLVGELIRLEAKLDQDIINNDHYDIRYNLYELETRILPRLSNLSKSIDASLTNPDQKAGEYKFTRSIAHDAARMLYKAGARACVAPDETYYAPESKCMKYGPTAELNPCAGKDQYLYDGKNNEGYCDCVEDERNLVYYQGECHQLNQQGSCQPDSWLILVNGVPTCQLVPGNCTTDGQQIYWSPDPKVPEECHQLGQRGPCAVGQVVTRDSTGYISCAAPPEVSLDTKEGQSKNGHAEKTQNVEKSLLEPVSCPVGSHRSQIAKCPKY